MSGEADRRWVVLSGVPGTLLVDGNPHTHRGRMSARDPESGRSVPFSLADVVDASASARAWIDGFLAGSEPEPADLYGAWIFDAGEDDPRWARWRAALADYRRTGRWEHAGWTHLLPFPAGAALPAGVWALRGDEVWTWAGDAWTRADPQPDRAGELLVGTVCGTRGWHSLAAVTDAQDVCEDCGLVSQRLPDGMSDEEYERVQFGYRPRALQDLGEDSGT